MCAFLIFSFKLQGFLRLDCCGVAHFCSRPLTVSTENSLAPLLQSSVNLANESFVNPAAHLQISSVCEQAKDSLHLAVRWFHLGIKGSGVIAWPHQIRLNWEKCLAQQKEVIWSTLNANEHAMCKLQKAPDTSKCCSLVGGEMRFQMLATFPILQSILSLANWIFISLVYKCLYCTHVSSFPLFPGGIKLD